MRSSTEEACVVLPSWLSIEVHPGKPQRGYPGIPGFMLCGPWKTVSASVVNLVSFCGIHRFCGRFYEVDRGAV